MSKLINISKKKQYWVIALCLLIMALTIFLLTFHQPNSVFTIENFRLDSNGISFLFQNRTLSVNFTLF